MVGVLSEDDDGNFAGVGRKGGEDLGFFRKNFFGFVGFVNKIGQFYKIALLEFIF